jgi:hypothetical protein
LLLTHEFFLALMLGTRRAGVAIALDHFERKGVVEYARGSITVMDRKGLEACADKLYGFGRYYHRAPADLEQNLVKGLELLHRWRSMLLHFRR